VGDSDVAGTAIRQRADREELIVAGELRSANRVAAQRSRRDAAGLSDRADAVAGDSKRHGTGARNGDERAGQYEGIAAGLDEDVLGKLADVSASLLQRLRIDQGEVACRRESAELLDVIGTVQSGERSAAVEDPGDDVARSALGDGAVRLEAHDPAGGAHNIAA